MARSAKYYSEWLQHDGKKVVIDGRRHTLRCQVYAQRYPYPDDVISVHAEPNRNTVHYRQEREKLGDHWSIDVLASDVELQAEILSQLQ